MLANDLKLVVNKTNTHITSLDKGVPFLGVVVHRKYIAVHPKRIKRFKNRVRKLTPRNSGRSVEELNQFLRGWSGYFQLRTVKSC
ncbi:MAG: group II intron maturase-specific domain-containing protein [Firmicutes bacterium]|nr:group II intron maturase-specific domain-containing protein [Bacillota bacterium]MDD4263291.1 group II intron maturase-specific domain-containing protein [Bacillota bacterium]MDD4693141.1 group II intron maturase-specific domain-containing protein [Bacillota bacterium]